MLRRGAPCAPRSVRHAPLARTEQRRAYTANPEIRVRYAPSPTGPFCTELVLSARRLHASWRFADVAIQLSICQEAQRYPRCNLNRVLLASREVSAAHRRHRPGALHFALSSLTPKTRLVPGAAENLARVLRWSGVPYDEGYASFSR